MSAFSVFFKANAPQVFPPCKQIFNSYPFSFFICMTDCLPSQSPSHTQTHKHGRCGEEGGQGRLAFVYGCTEAADPSLEMFSSIIHGTKSWQVTAELQSSCISVCYTTQKVTGGNTAILDWGKRQHIICAQIYLLLFFFFNIYVSYTFLIYIQIHMVIRT